MHYLNTDTEQGARDGTHDGETDQRFTSLVSHVPTWLAITLSSSGFRPDYRAAYIGAYLATAYRWHHAIT